MERRLMDRLVAWKDAGDRKPLILYGARQTGKTWLLEEFGRRFFDNTVRIDFMFDRQARALFEQDLDPERILRSVETIYSCSIDPQTTLLIFDEIQEAPQALTSLKYFCERARDYHVVAAGSYMGIASRRDGTSFPVGKVDTLTLRPCSFSEFLAAQGYGALAFAVQTDTPDTVKDLFGEKLTELLRTYFVVGGMPEAVANYSEHHDIQAVRHIQQEILVQYDGDFSKHAPGRILERMRQVWASLPSQLARDNKKFIYGAVRDSGRARDFEESIQWLRDYGVVYKVPRVSALRHPLASYDDENAFKLFALDIGLLGAQADLRPEAVTEGSAVFTEFKGALTEQYVLQELVVQGYAPRYWSSENSGAEIDFAIDSDTSVIPIEVKATENLRSKSLRSALEHFGLNRAVRTSLSGYRDEGWLVNIPLWALSALPLLIDPSAG